MINSQVLAALGQVLAMAETHVEDVETGLEEGLYDANDNTDLATKEEAVSIVKKFITEIQQSSGQKISIVFESIVMDMLAKYGEEVSNDKEINGGDVVDDLAGWVVQAQTVLN